MLVAMRRGVHRASVLACAAFVASAAPVTSCGTTDVPVLAAGGDDAGSSSGADGAVAVEAGTRADYCAGSGPPVLVDTSGDAGPVAVCTAGLAQVAFRYALCTCDGYTSDHALTTDAFDGTQGPYDPAHPLAGGSVGSNGNVNATGPMTIGGSLWASDATGLTTNAAIAAAGELHAQGEAHTGPTLGVGTDAWLANGLQTSGDVTIAGTLHVPASAPVDVGGTKSIGAVADGPVSVPPACDCDPAARVDVAGLVESYRNANDDAAAGVDPTLLENVTAPLAATLPCGRIFFTRVGAGAAVHLTAQGRVAVFVGGDLSASSDFQIDVPGGSEVDLFVEGGVTVGGAFLVGSPANPARARTYVGGTGTVNLQGASQLAGNLYAPQAELVLGGSAATTLFGSIFAARLSASADLTVHFDEAVLTQNGSTTCALPTGCTTCRDCGGQACNSGTCGGCADSTQCCAPLVCRAGACVANIQ
jgi:hypothetical protein